MKPTKAYITILIASLLGLMLSGYLSYWNLFGPSCLAGPLDWLISCGGPQKVLIFGLPTCVYGFVMYVAIAVTALIGLRSEKQRAITALLLGFGSAGTLFAGGLTIYELWILKMTFTGLPACVYGLVLYAVITIAAVIAFRKVRMSHAPEVR